MKKNVLKLTNLEMSSIKGGASDGALRPIGCWFCGCGGDHMIKLSASSGKTQNHKKRKVGL